MAKFISHITEGDGNSNNKLYKISSLSHYSVTFPITIFVHGTTVRSGQGPSNCPEFRITLRPTRVAKTTLDE